MFGPRKIWQPCRPVGDNVFNLVALKTAYRNPDTAVAACLQKCSLLARKNFCIEKEFSFY
jgi:hypothetical protein